MKIVCSMNFPTFGEIMKIVIFAALFCFSMAAMAGAEDICPTAHATSAQVYVSYIKTDWGGDNQTRVGFNLASDTTKQGEFYLSYDRGYQDELLSFLALMEAFKGSYPVYIWCQGGVNFSSITIGR